VTRPGPFWGLVAPMGCAVLLAIGQMLFKQAASHLDFARPFADTRGVGYLGAALVLYAVATVAWVSVLAHAPLVQVYPLMALSFVLVPIGAMFFLKEHVNWTYWLGTALLLGGLVVISRSQVS
jgi:drug/metabolite transporter (DMT)-like permease